MNPVVLFWSRNPDLYMLFSYIFGIAGFTSTLIDDEELGEVAARATVLAIILDTENNTEHALRICSRMKADQATAHIPLLALIRSGDQHFLDLLKVGVNETFVRPISPARVLSYLQSLLHGSSGDTADPSGSCNLFNVWELSLETSQRLVRYGSAEIQLGPIEFKLLYRLLQAPGRVFSRAELIEAAWPANHYVLPRTVDVHVGRLRRMLNEMTGRNIIRTIRSGGYAAEFG